MRWWAALSVVIAPPVISRELQRDDMVVCDTPEALDALRYAVTLDGWDDAVPPLRLALSPVLCPAESELPPGVAPNV